MKKKHVLYSFVENMKGLKINMKRRIPYWSIGLGIGVLFLVIGLHEGQFKELYQKAVMICLECIGIG